MHPVQQLFHRLWTKAVGTRGYDKEEWKELRKLVDEHVRQRQQMAVKASAVDVRLVIREVAMSRGMLVCDRCRATWPVTPDAMHGDVITVSVQQSKHELVAALFANTAMPLAKGDPTAQSVNMLQHLCSSCTKAVAVLLRDVFSV